jgi:hypothetical protein
VALNFVAGYVDFGSLTLEPVGGSELTLMGWVKIHELVDVDPRIISKGSSPALTDQSWTLICRRVSANPAINGRAEFRVRIDGSPATTNIRTVSVVTLGEWHHIVGTYDGISQAIYLDGVEENRAPLTGPLETDPGGRLVWLGDQPVINGLRQLIGDLEDVRIYMRALGPDEIATIYASRGKDAIYNGLFTRWPLQDFGVGVVAGSVTDISTKGCSGAGVANPSLPTFSEGILTPRQRRTIRSPRL